MATGRFLDKLRLAGAAVLRTFEPVAFARTLEAHQVGIAFDNSAADSSEAKITLELLANLLARLYPRIVMAPRGERASAVAGELAAIAKAINPLIDVEQSAESASAYVAVGSHDFGFSAPTVFAGSDGWTFKISSTAPVGSGPTENPFGAAAAAAVAAANIFRVVFKDQLTDSGLDQSICRSLVDLDNPHPDRVNPALATAELRDVHFVGLGAVGNAAIWALSRVPELTGSIHLIDKEATDVGNLQRYVLMRDTDVDEKKVELAARELQKSTLRVSEFAVAWQTYIAQRHDWNLSTVAVALDSAADRRAVQSALPRLIINSWTQPGDLGISRHRFIDAQACLVCLYMPEGKTKSEDELIRDALQLPADEPTLRAVRELLHTNAPIGPQWCQRVAAALNVPLEAVMPFAWKPIRSLYVEGICSGAIISFADQTGNVDLQVPMAFQSVFAGILLAAELVLQGTRHRPESFPATTKANLLSSLGEHFSLPARKHPSGRCICQDTDFIAAFRVKHTK